MKYKKILIIERDSMTCAYTPKAGWKKRESDTFVGKETWWTRGDHWGDVDLLAGLRWILMKYGPSIRVSLGIQIDCRVEEYPNLNLCFILRSLNKPRNYLLDQVFSMKLSLQPRIMTCLC